MEAPSSVAVPGLVLPIAVARELAAVFDNREVPLLKDDDAELAVVLNALLPSLSTAVVAML